MLHVLLPAALTGYVLGIVLAAVGTMQRSTLANRSASAVFALSWVLHGAAIVRIGVLAGRVPLGTGYEYLLVLGWALLALHLYIAFRHHVPVAGLVLPPIAAIATAAALTVAHPVTRELDTTGRWFLFHTSISTLGMASLGAAFGMAVLYLAQDHALKSRSSIAWLQRLPSLQKCDQIGLQTLIVGFILLTLGIGTGIVVNLNVEEPSTFLSRGAKQVFPVLAWALFLAVLVARTWLGYRGRRSALLTIAGFLLALASVAGMTL